MKQLFKLLVGGMLLMAMPLMMTSCEGTLDDIFGEWSRPTQKTPETPPKPVAVTGVTLDQTTLSLVAGTTGQLTATVSPNDAADKTVTWASADETIATVDVNGKVTAVAYGQTTITATATNGTPDDASDDFSATCTVSIIDMLHTPLTLEAIEDGTIHLTFGDGLDLAKPITYTKNGVEYSGGTTNFDITVSAGDIVTFHSTNAALGKIVSLSYKHLSIKPTNRCYIYGNIMSLINDAGDFATDKIIGDKYALYALFSEANKLENDPAKDILLPATTLTDYCYNYLFGGCSALTKAPALPATVLKLRCYEQMFWECTSLTEASVMSATTVDDYCCHDMFNGCTNLVKAPELLATTLTQYCYNGMFKGCSKLNYLKCLATDVSASECLGGWLGEVSATGTLVVASGTTWAVAGTNYPSGWTVTEE